MSPFVRRLPRTVALALIIGIGIFNLYHAVVGWTLSDAGAYWNAAMRLREGADLYPALASVEGSEIFRYAPWFAWVTVPFTYLPGWLVGTLWSAVLLAASAAALDPLLRARAWPLVLLMAPILVGISAIGNVHPLIVAALVLGVERRSGPVWIALAASLKIFPILFAVVYAGRGQWGRFALSVALTALLWAPALLYNLDHYAVDPGQAASIYAVPLLYALVVGLGALATYVLAPLRYGWIAAATTVVLALPRLFVYDVTYLMVGWPNGQASSRATSRSARSIE